MIANHPVGFGQCRRFFLEFVARGLEAVGELCEVFLALAEFGFELCLRGLGGRGLAQHALAVHIAYLQFLCLCTRGRQSQGHRGRQLCKRDFH